MLPRAEKARAMAASPKEYREFAEECLRGAAETKSERHREVLLEMAKTWTQAIERGWGLTADLPTPRHRLGPKPLK
jgi:hypothetical protein